MISFEENKIQASAGGGCQESLCETAFELRREWHEAASPVKLQGKSVPNR